VISPKSFLIRQLAYGCGGANGEFALLEHVLSENRFPLFGIMLQAMIQLDHGLDSLF
jgi:hypothetical protein